MEATTLSMAVADSSSCENCREGDPPTPVSGHLQVGGRKVSQHHHVLNGSRGLKNSTACRGCALDHCNSVEANEAGE